MRYLWLALLLCLTMPGLAHAAPVRIGSKQFTEAVILGELARISAREAGIDAIHQRELGGTRILWRALRQGDIDAYPEYTGTLTQELLTGMPANADIASLRKRLEPMGIGITDSLGFDNTYAIGMRADEAARLGVTRISDLRTHPELRFGLSNEFMDRETAGPGCDEVTD